MRYALWNQCLILGRYLFICFVIVTSSIFKQQNLNNHYPWFLFLTKLRKASCSLSFKVFSFVPVSVSSFIWSAFLRIESWIHTLYVVDDIKVMQNSYQHFGSLLSTAETGFFPGKHTCYLIFIVMEIFHLKRSLFLSSYRFSIRNINKSGKDILRLLTNAGESPDSRGKVFVSSIYNKQTL